MARTKWKKQFEKASVLTQLIMLNEQFKKRRERELREQKRKLLFDRLLRPTFGDASDIIIKHLIPTISR